MSLPQQLLEALQIEAERIPRSKLITASSELSRRYRSQDRDSVSTFMTSDAHRLAYLAVRMPATYAVIQRVLFEVKKRIPDLILNDVLDVGAGPGTAAWAAADVFPELKQATLLEKDSSMVEIGRRMMQKSMHPMLKSAIWNAVDLKQGGDVPQHELVILSYVVGELPVEAVSSLITNAWNACSQVFVVIEPGTPHGFERIRAIREQLIHSGAYLVAPCPHAERCPMAHGDWCHFSERLERNPLHMDVKDVTMGYEDEKFSYVAVAKFPVKLPEARILRHPQKRTGHIGFTLCTCQGLEQRVISKRQGEVYKQARKWEWGDVIEGG